MTSNIYISAIDVEFLLAFLRKLRTLERICKTRPSPEEYDLLSICLRGILQQREYVRANTIAGLKPEILRFSTGYEYTIRDPSSPAIHKMQFHPELDQGVIKFFRLLAKPEQYVVVVPSVGFVHDLPPQASQGEPIAIEEYLSEPIFCIGTVLVNRNQLIKYRANKKGLGHYSEERTDKWASALDALWNIQAEHPRHGYKNRWLNELIFRICQEVLLSPNTRAILELSSRIETDKKADGYDYL